MKAEVAVLLLGTATTSALHYLTDKQKLMLTLSRLGVLDRVTQTKIWGAGRRYTFDTEGFCTDVCDYTSDMSRSGNRHT